MKKRHLVTAAAALAAAAFLTACSGGGEQAQAPAGGSEAAGTEAGGETAEVEEIVFAYMTQNNIPETVDLERIQNLINEYTEEKINTFSSGATVCDNGFYYIFSMVLQGPMLIFILCKHTAGI